MIDEKHEASFNNMMKNERIRIMKKTKLFLSVMLALIMTLAMAVPVFADNGSGILTIENTNDGDTYTVYRVLDLTVSGEHYAYTINENFTSFFKNKTYNGKDITTAEQAYNFIKSNNDLPGLAKELENYVTDGMEDGWVRASGESATIDNLLYGYYLMVPSSSKTSLSVVFSLDTHAPRQTIQNKSSYPTIDKEADTNVPYVGQTVKFTITGEVPDISGYDSYKYKITDTMSSSLTLNTKKDEYTLYIGEEKVTIPEGSLFIDETNNSFELTIPLTGENYKTGEKIKLEYTAIVNENALTSENGITNNATLTYSNNPSGTGEGTSNPPVVKLYTYKLNISKYDGADQTPLPGAEFVLKTKNDDGSVKAYLKINNDKTVSWVENETDATTFPSDNNGKVSITGIGEGTYYLEETVAPTDYNKLTEDKKITISEPTGADADNGGVIEMDVEVPNYSGAELPNTGGIGTTIFYVLGAVLVIGAGIFLVVRRRMSGNNQ